MKVDQSIIDCVKQNNPTFTQKQVLKLAREVQRFAEDLEVEHYFERLRYESSMRRIALQQLTSNGRVPSLKELSKAGILVESKEKIKGRRVFRINHGF